MALTIFALLGLFIPGIRIRKPEDGDYLSRKVTSSFLGIFVLVIFLAHVLGKMGSEAWYDIIATRVYHSLVGQMMVVPFFFFSAYGIVKQFQKQGRKIYLSNFFVHRFLKVYLMFVISIFLIAVFASACTGFQTFSLDPLTLTVYGANLWFIFAILVLYVLIFISLLIFGEKKWPLFITIMVLSIGFIAVMVAIGKDPHWYNTIISFPLGVGFALFRDKIDAWFNSSKRRLIVYIIATVIYFGTLSATEFVDLTTIHLALYITVYTIRVISFITSMILFLMMLTFGNKALVEISKYSLVSYIIQFTIFDIFMTTLDVKSISIYLFFVVTLAVTAVLTFGITLLYNWLFKISLGKLSFKPREEPAK